MSAPAPASRWPQTAAIAIVIALVLLLLVVGRKLLVPLAIAVVIWFLLNAGARALGRLSLAGRSLPGWLAMALTMLIGAVIVLLVVNMVASNLAAIAQAAPRYQANLEGLMAEVMTTLSIEQLPEFGQLGLQFDLQRILLLMVNALGGLAANAGLIFIYVAFLLLEQRFLPVKLKALFPAPEDSRDLRRIIGRIRDDVLTYVWIKTIVSLLTGGLCYLVLRVAGLDNAIFWAFLIFLLNFIPTVGSLIAIVFPTLLALAQFADFTTVAILFVCLAAIQIVVGNFIDPRLMGRTLNISTLVVMLSLVVWGSLWGIVGAFLSVPITVVGMIVLSYFPKTRPIAILLSADGRVGPDSRH